VGRGYQSPCERRRRIHDQVPDVDKGRRAVSAEQVKAADATLSAVTARIAKQDEKNFRSRIVTYLERAAYVDLRCDPLEMTLVRWATKHVAAHLNSPGVAEELEKIKTSYVPASTDKTLFGSMQDRVRLYAAQILDKRGVEAKIRLCNKMVAFRFAALIYATRRLHMNSIADRIEKQIVLKAPRAKVWRALSNAEEFGTWFRVDLKGKKFEAGKRTTGKITYPGCEHILFDVTVERVEPEKLLTMRWHPYAVDPKVDYSKEPTTLIEFTLQDIPGGTLLKVVESGFDKLPPERRDEAFRMNSGGWEQQMKNIQAHVANA
jgi:uncharacterized protein YndB with AHSA1/START domain